MKCFLCNNEIVTGSDEYNVRIAKETNYSCLSCHDLLFTVYFPGEELVSFRMYLGRGYTITGAMTSNAISIIYSKNAEDSVTTMPWISVSGFDNIIEYLKNLSEKYEIYVTFS